MAKRGRRQNLHFYLPILFSLPASLLGKKREINFVIVALHIVFQTGSHLTCYSSYTHYQSNYDRAISIS